VVEDVVAVVAVVVVASEVGADAGEVVTVESIAVPVVSVEPEVHAETARTAATATTSIFGISITSFSRRLRLIDDT
jgi:hypothetical protein